MYMSIAIHTTNINKTFGSGALATPVLHNISLEVPAGELAMVVGPSGCGKTTLISIIAGILTPTSGTLELFGESFVTLRGNKLVRFRRENIGFIFQQYNLLPALTAVENASIPLIAQGVSATKAESQAAAMLNRIGMGAHLYKKPNQLSGGQQQRVAIARALVHNPRLVVCDEPTAALDAASGQTVMEILRELAVQPSRAVLVVTHDNRIYKFADRIIRMEDGRVVGVDLTPQTAPTASSKGKK